MSLSILFCELRADRAGDDDQRHGIILARLQKLLRRAREAQWSVSHAGLKRTGRKRGGPIPGLEPLRSEAVFFVDEAGGFDPRPLLDTIAGAERPLAVAGYGFAEIMAPLLSLCAREGRPALLVEDAVAWGLERDFALRALARDGVRVTSVDALLAGKGRLVPLSDFTKR